MSSTSDEKSAQRYTLELDHELKLIRYKHIGLIEEKDINVVWVKLLEMKEFTDQKYNLLSDYTQGKFNIQPQELPTILEFMRNIEHIVRGKKQALVVSEPLTVAISVLFQIQIRKEVGFNVKIYSSVENALEWLSV